MFLSFLPWCSLLSGYHLLSKVFHRYNDADYIQKHCANFLFVLFIYKCSPQAEKEVHDNHKNIILDLRHFCVNKRRTQKIQNMCNWINNKKWTGTEISALPMTSLHVIIDDFCRKGEYYEGIVELKNPGKYLAFAVTLGLRNAMTNTAIRPVYFDDGYFSLMPGESKRIYFQVAAKQIRDTMELQVGGYNVQTKKMSL